MEVRIGRVTHYFNRIGVAVVDLDPQGELSMGDRIHILGNTTNFEQTVSSMEIDHQIVESVQAGDDVALKVDSRVRAGDEIFRVEGTRPGNG
jgi:putative protease